MNKCHFEIKENAQTPVNSKDVLFVRTDTNKDVTSLAMIVDDAGALAWGDSFKQEMKEAALNSHELLPDIVFKTTKKIIEKEGVLPTSVPSFLISRISNGMFEAFAFGNCGMVVHYQDGVVETYEGQKQADMKFPKVAMISRDRRRNLSTYTNSSIWSLTARVEAVQSVALLPASDENEPARPVHRIALSKRTALLLDLVDERQHD